MQSTIRYARTDDGVNIAYGDVGEGAPLIYLPALPWCNFAVCYNNPLTSVHPEELSASLRLLTYDGRGCGLSDHDAADLTLDGFARGIDAVADAAGLERFALYGSADGSRVMVHYAATRPERVSALVLWLPSVSPDRIRDAPVLRAIAPLVERDWEVFIRTLSHAVVGGWDAERASYADAFADMARGGIRQEEFRHFAHAMREHDVSADLARVQAPTLVLTREDAAVYTLPVVREVAAGIPGARLVVMPGNWLMPCTTSEDITREITAFLGDGLPEETDAVPAQVLPPARQAGMTGDLSPREYEVLALISHGRTNAEIAAELVVTHATASRHVHNILTKLGMSRRAEAAAYAARAGTTPRAQAATRP